MSRPPLDESGWYQFVAARRPLQPLPAEERGVDVNIYEVIYQVTDDIKAALEDRLDGNFSSAVSYLHFHPDVRLFPAEDRMECPSGRQIGYRVLHGSQSLVEDIYHPEFGGSVRSRCLNISMPTGLGAIRLSFAKNP